MISRVHLYFTFAAIVRIGSANLRPPFLEIDAAGRAANLGDAYDAVYDTFTAISAYKETLPEEAKQVVDGPTPVFSDFKLIHEYTERNSFLGIDASLATSAYLGLFELDGRAQAAKSFKLRSNFVNGILSYSFKKGTIRLNTASAHAQRLLFRDAINISGASHIVVEVDMGVTLAIGFYFALTESENRTKLESQLTAEMNGLTHGIEGSQAWNYEETTTLKRTTFKAVMFTDKQFNMTIMTGSLTDIYNALKRIPEYLTNPSSNGVPIRYRLHTIDTVLSLSGHPKTAKDNDTLNFFKNVKKLERMQNQILSLYYSNDAIEQQYAELVDKVSTYHDILPEGYGKSLQHKYRTYARKFKAKNEIFKEIIIRARSNYTAALAKRAKRVVERCKNSTRAGSTVKIRKFLLDLSRNVTEKITDANKLKGSGFKYVSKTETEKDAAISHGSEVVVIFFIQQKWRRSDFQRHANCILLGNQIKATKYVYDCDFNFHKTSCAGMNTTVIITYRNGMVVAEDNCKDGTLRSSKVASSILNHVSAILPTPPFSG